jgi:hypothetical protein
LSNFFCTCLDCFFAVALLATIMRKQLSISCATGTLWERIEHASKLTGMGPNEIGREVIEIYLDKWLEAHQAKLEALARQGVSVPGSASAERTKAVSARKSRR